jgi:hypothetical protein
VLLCEPRGSSFLSIQAISRGFAGSETSMIDVPSSPGWHSFWVVSIAIAAIFPSGESWMSFWPPGQSKTPARFGLVGSAMSTTTMPSP